MIRAGGDDFLTSLPIWSPTAAPQFDDYVIADMVVNGIAYPVIHIEGNATDGCLLCTLFERGNIENLLCYNPRTDEFEYQTPEDNTTMEYIIDAAGYSNDPRVSDDGNSMAPDTMTKEMITFKL